MSSALGKNDIKIERRKQEKKVNSMLKDFEAKENAVICSVCSTQMVSAEEEKYNQAVDLWTRLCTTGRIRDFHDGCIIDLVIDAMPKRPYMHLSSTDDRLTDIWVQLINDEEQLRKRWGMQESRLENYLGLPARLESRESNERAEIALHLHSHLASSELINSKVVFDGMQGICPKCNNQVIFCGPKTRKKREVQQLIDEIKNRSGDIEHHERSLNNQVDIPSYLKVLVDISQNIMMLERWLGFLIDQKITPDTLDVYKQAVNEIAEYDQDSGYKSLMIKIDNISNQIQQLKEQREEVEDIQLSDKELGEIIIQHGYEIPQKPIEPEKPVLETVNKSALVEPSKPIIKKAGFFNKKKVEQENAEAQTVYEAKFKKYKEELEKHSKNEEKNKEYQILQNEYLEQQKQYDHNMKQIYDAIDPIIIEKTKEKIQKKKTEIESKIQRLEDDHKILLSEINNSMETGAIANKVWDTGHSYAALKRKQELIGAEIEEVKENLRIQYNSLNNVLEPEIIFPKYNNAVAWSTMYEYFLTGRVTELTGPNGAYNLYESELRANIIISKMDVIINQLDAIRENQYVLYNVINKINTKLDTISRGVGDVIELMDKTNSKLEQIADSNKAIQYLSEKTAMYSEITANTNKAIMFMKLIWG